MIVEIEFIGRKNQDRIHTRKIFTIKARNIFSSKITLRVSKKLDQFIKFQMVFFFYRVSYFRGKSFLDMVDIRRRILFVPYTLGAWAEVVRD